MVTQAHIDGGWTELKGKVKEAWGQISGDELREFEGDVDQLVGMIQRKTGEAREEIERRLAELDARFQPMLAQMQQAAREYYEQTMQATGDTVERARREMAARHAQAEELVRQRPFESVAVAFGTGIIAGVVLGLIARSR